MQYLKFFSILVILILSISIGYAEFEDGFQDHPSDDLEQGDENILWDKDTDVSGSSAVVGQYVQNYNKVAKLTTHALAAGRWASIYNVYPEESTYFSFVNNYVYYPGTSSFTNYRIYLYDKNGNIIGTYHTITTQATAYKSNDTFEFVVSSGNLLCYVNGVYVTTYGAVATTPYYYKLYLYRLSAYTGSAYWYIDSFSTDGYVISVGTDESPYTYINTASNNEIDVEWTVNTIDAYGDWDDYTYQMRVKWLDTNTVVNTTTLSKTKPNGFVIYNRSTLMPVPNYGVYRFDLLKNSVIMESDYLTFLPIGSSGTLDWDRLNYVPYQNASIDYAVSPYAPTTNNYYIRTYEINTGLIDTNTLTSASGTITEYLSGWDVGTYYSLLVVSPKNGDDEYTIAYDIFDINDEVVFQGYTYDALAGSTLDTTYVNFTQSSTWYNTTSNSSAWYELEGLSDLVEITINASKTNYTHEDFEFTPPTSAIYSMNLYLFPTNLSTITNGTGTLEGMTVDYPLHQAVGSSSVYIYNATWSKAINTNSFGYYNLSGMAPGTYSVIGSNSDYDNSTTYSVTISANSTTVQNLVLTRNYMLTVRATDASTGSYITTFTATVDGTDVSTTNGYARFNLSWDLYTVSVAATDYYGNSKNVLLNQNRTVTVSLTKTPSIYYPQHYVKFIVQNLWGTTRYQNIDVNCYNGSSTTALYTGSTDSVGSVTFVLSETNKYRLTFTNSTQGVNEVFWVYPKEDKYYIIVSSTSPWTDYGAQLTDSIVFGVTKNTINSTHAYINVTYQDNLSDTTNVDVWLNRSNPNNKQNQTNVDSNTGETGNFTHSFIVSNYADSTFFIKFDVVHGTYGTFARDYSVYFEQDIKVDQLPESVYLYLAVMLLFFTGGLFMKTSAEVGALITCGEAWVFKFWGWFDTLGNQDGFNAALILATLVSLIAIWNAKSKEENVD